MAILRQPGSIVRRLENFTVAAYVHDAVGTTCAVLGLMNPWTMNVTIKPGTGAPGAGLVGDTDVDFELGTGTMQLGINATGAGYVLVLRSSEGGFSVETSPFDVGDEPIEDNPWETVLAAIMVAILLFCFWLRRYFKRRGETKIAPSILDGVVSVASIRVATPDLQFLPRPSTFVGVSIDDLFARDRTTLATLLPSPEHPAMLEVEVCRARNLKRMDMGGLGKSDPFCVVEQGKVSHYTRVIDNNLFPIWNESFSFQVKNENRDLILTMFDKDTGGADVMGEVRFKLTDLVPFEVDKQWHPLRKAKLMKRTEKVKGDIQLAIRYSPQLGEPHELPLVLRRIIKTLQTEAIDLVGVFRLASEGAGKSMRQLKRPHEEHNERLSKLRYDHDPMALASLLIYLLSQLPEPLVPTELLDACVRIGTPLLRLKNSALHAKFAAVEARVEAVLEAMPQTHFLVLVRLLGMLQRFSQNSAVNLMTAHNLAVAFAAVIFRAEEGSAKKNEAALAALLRLWIELGPKPLRRPKLMRMELKDLLVKAASEGVPLDDLEDARDLETYEETQEAVVEMLLGLH